MFILTVRFWIDTSWTFTIFSLQSGKKLPTHLSYSLRFPGSECPRTDRLFKDAYTSDAYSTYHSFKEFGFGFLTLQNEISKAFINQINSSAHMPNISMLKFPTPSSARNFIIDNAISIPIVLSISFFYAFLNFVRYINDEKENQLKETMKIMGLSNIQQHASWFVRTMTMLSLPILVITILLKVTF